MGPAWPIEVSPLQSIKIFGLWDQPRRIVLWEDIRGHSWRALRFDFGFTPEQLQRLQPDKKEWIARGSLTLHDVADMSLFPINPFTDLKADLAEVWSMQWSPEALAAMGVTYDQLAHAGMTPVVMAHFGFPLSAWVQLGLAPRHVASEQHARVVFGLSLADVRAILRDHAPPESDGSGRVGT